MNLKVRMVEGQYEDNNQTFICPVVFPMRDMTNYANEDLDGPDYVTLYNEADLEAWCKAAFGEEWGIFNMSIPLGAIVGFNLKGPAYA